MRQKIVRVHPDQEIRQSLLVLLTHITMTDEVANQNVRRKSNAVHNLNTVIL